MTRFDPPPTYDQPHRDLWASITASLTAGGRIFQADPAVIDALVEARHTHQRATSLLNQTDVLIARGGRVAENPALAVQRKSAETIARLSRALGLDRLPITPPGASAPMSPPELPGRWCDQHKRRECVHNRTNGLVCHAASVKGTDSCRKHAGKTLEALKADGVRALARLAPPIEVSPGQGLLEEVHRSAGMVAWYESECAQLPEEALWRGVTKQVDRDGVLETTTEMKPHVLLAALNREREHFASVCDRALARGAEAQIVDMAKMTAVLATRVMDKVLADLELSEEQRALVPRVVPAAFRAITSGPGR